MNNRHIQTFLTVSAAFFAMSAPLHANAGVRSLTTNPACRTEQAAVPTKADESQSITIRAERDA